MTDSRAKPDREANAASLGFPRWRLALVTFVIAIVLVSPLWGPQTLSHLEFFRLRKVEIRGVRYTPIEEVLRRLGVDTTRSVWDPLAPLAERVRTHPEVEDVTVTRQLPGTLVIDVTERRPVALVPRPEGLRAVDERGIQLPLDASRTPVDAPVVTAAPSTAAVYHLLGAMQRNEPHLYARISSIRASGNEFVLDVAGLSVRALTSVSLARLSDIQPVERDLARRQLRAAELDLRYRDQVIARLP